MVGNICQNNTVAAGAWSLCQNLVHARFQYASTTLLLRYCRAGYDYAALSSRFCGARGFPRRFCYDPTTTIKIRLRLVYAVGDAVATLPRPRRWSYAFVAIMIPFYIKSTVVLVYVQLNVNFQRYEQNYCRGFVLHYKKAYTMGLFYVVPTSNHNLCFEQK